MALVQVPDRRLAADGGQRPDAANAKDDLLLDTRLAVSAVQARRKLTIPRRVLFEIRVEQVQADAPQTHAPDRDEHRAVAERNGCDRGLPVGRQRRLHGGLNAVEPFVHLDLPALCRHALMEIALRVHEAHSDERHSQIARFLAVIAGQHAKPARIDRQRLMQRELRREIGDRASVQLGETGGRPCVLGVVRRVEAGHGGVVERQPLVVVGRLFEPFGCDGPQHLHRVVSRVPPERIVESPKDAARQTSASSTTDRTPDRRGD